MFADVVWFHAVNSQERFQHFSQRYQEVNQPFAVEVDLRWLPESGIVLAHDSPTSKVDFTIESFLRSFFSLPGVMDKCLVVKLDVKDPEVLQALSSIFENQALWGTFSLSSVWLNADILPERSQDCRSAFHCHCCPFSADEATAARTLQAFAQLNRRFGLGMSLGWVLQGHGHSPTTTCYNAECIQAMTSFLSQFVAVEGTRLGVLTFPLRLSCAQNSETKIMRGLLTSEPAKRFASVFFTFWKKRDEVILPEDIQWAKVNFPECTIDLD